MAVGYFIERISPLTCLLSSESRFAYMQILGRYPFRDHVYVDDIAQLVYLAALHKSIGIFNAVSGEIVSFKELAEFIQ